MYFTFQSGYIQMSSLLYDTHMHRSLHSNLVIFKYMTPGAELKSVTTLHSNLVIFKFFKKLSRYLPNYLYIPIWLYSNIDVLSGIITFITFTFQSGYIQINIFWLNPRVYHHSLHSNILECKERCN